MRPCSMSARAAGHCHRTPSRTTRTPRGGPPHERASPTSTSQSGGTSSRPSEAIASTTRGMPWAPAASRASARGWRVPTSPFALWSDRHDGARHRQGRTPGVEVETSRPVDADLGEQRRVVGGRRAGPARHEHGGVLHRGGHRARPTPAGGIRHPVDGPGQRGGTAGQEAHLGGSHSEPGCDDLPGAVEQRACPTALGVEGGRVGPAHLDRGPEGVAGDGVQGAGRPRRAVAALPGERSRRARRRSSGARRRALGPPDGATGRVQRSCPDRD